MVGYENTLSIVYHSGPSIYGCQAMRMKQVAVIGSAGSANCQIIADVEVAISRYSTMSWIGYSEEGMLYTFDNEGVLRTYNPLSR
jgi:hypothetical protein